MSVAFVTGENQRRQIQALQDALRGDTFHVHVTGEPGIVAKAPSSEAYKQIIYVRSSS